MKRREFVKMGGILAGSFACAAGVGSVEERIGRVEPVAINGFSLDGHTVRIYNSAIKKPLKIMALGDTHLSLDDERGEPYRQYSKRMSQTGKHSQSHFKTTLQHTKESKSDLVVLMGDIFSFPSEAAIEWTHKTLLESGLSYLYVAGNHDWHYEGMEGSSSELRKIWVEKRLTPMYQGLNPYISHKDVNGIRCLVVDNSTYEIMPEQLQYLRVQVAAGVPMLIFQHIPLYAPGRPVFFGCGHPEWGAANDPYWEIERREKWRESGHTSTTMEFYNEVLTAPNVMGIFAGHIHRQSLDCLGSKPQVVCGANSNGHYINIELQPC